MCAKTSFNIIFARWFTKQASYVDASAAHISVSHSDDSRKSVEQKASPFASSRPLIGSIDHVSQRRAAEQTLHVAKGKLRGEKKKALPLNIIIECDGSGWGSGRDHNGNGNFIALTRDCFISLFISSSRWRNFEGEKWRVLHQHRRLSRQLNQSTEFGNLWRKSSSLTGVRANYRSSSP